MPARKIPMRKVKETLRLSLDSRLPYDQIAQALGLSKGVISKYTRQALAAGLDWSAIEAVTFHHIQANWFSAYRSQLGDSTGISDAT